jgi:hypothetical protein
MGGDELYFLHEASESNYIAPLGPQVDAIDWRLGLNVL